jgi:hypothetical protein
MNQAHDGDDERADDRRQTGLGSGRQASHRKTAQLTPFQEIDHVIDQVCRRPIRRDLRTKFVPYRDAISWRLNCHNMFVYTVQ